MKRYLDLAVQGLVVETDVKFCIRTLHDFFVFSSFWEEEVQNAFQFREGMHFLDVGAHIGKYALRAARKAGKSGKVIAVEPDKENFNILVRNIELNGLQNCVALNIAAYYADGSVVLFGGPSSAQHSIKENFGLGSARIRARALDNVLKEIGIPKMDLIKIDVEGAELEVLRGLKDTLSRCNPVVIVELEKKDEDKVIRYLEGLAYRKKLLHIYLPYKEGLVYYKFEKLSKRLHRLTGARA